MLISLFDSFTVSLCLLLSSPLPFQFFYSMLLYTSSLSQSQALSPQCMRVCVCAKCCWLPITSESLMTPSPLPFLSHSLPVHGLIFCHLFIQQKKPHAHVCLCVSSMCLPDCLPLLCSHHDNKETLRTSVCEQML